MRPFDHGEQNIPLSKRFRGGLDAEIARQMKVIRREQAETERAKAAERRVKREAEKAREKFTAADLANASHVCDRYGWHKVVRISAKSVTVETGYSWTDRIALDKVVQYAVNGKTVAGGGEAS